MLMHLFHRYIIELVSAFVLEMSMVLYVLGKYEQFTLLCDVKIGQALGLLFALNWVHELNFGSC
jgi:hypothetical protein